MDEIDFYKKTLKLTTIFFSVTAGIIIFLLITSRCINKEVILCTVAILGGYYVIALMAYYIVKLILIGRFSIGYFYNKNFDREILDEYPPAICSFLYNKKIESYADYTATILNLECKKYLKVTSDGKDITILKENVEELYEHEKYVMNCIMKKTEFDMAKFNKTITDDLLYLNLVAQIENKENKESKTILKNPFIQILLSIFIFLLLLYLMVLFPKVMTEILIYIVGVALIIAIIEPIVALSLSIKFDGDEIKVKLTKQGRNARKYAFGLKRFLREYTLINEREMKEKEIFENYIAYALSLGEAKVVEQFVSENQEYRRLIYKNKEN